LAENVRTVFLPPYAPELNPQEHIWDELREKFFHNRAFDTLDALETHLEGALKSFESNPESMCSIAGWEWIIIHSDINNVALISTKPSTHAAFRLYAYDNT